MAKVEGDLKNPKAKVEGDLKNSKLSDDIPVSDLNLPPEFSTDVKVVKVHDGDSCHVHLIYEGNLFRFKCRLAKIDTPEIGQRGSLVARDYLAHLCTGGGENSFDNKPPRHTELNLQQMLDNNHRLVFAIFSGRGIYGRALVQLQRAQNSAESFNTMLLKKKYAKKYGE